MTPSKQRMFWDFLAKSHRPGTAFCRLFLFTILIFALALISAGCGGSGGKLAVSGTVKLGGKALDHGTITFTSEDLETQAGGEIVDGAYSIPAESGLPPGKYTVRISSPEEAVSDAADAPGPEAAAAENKDRIPPEYNTQSKETREVTEAGPNEFNFDIP